MFWRDFVLGQRLTALELMLTRMWAVLARKITRCFHVLAFAEGRKLRMEKYFSDEESQISIPILEIYKIQKSYILTFSRFFNSDFEIYNFSSEKYFSINFFLFSSNISNKLYAHPILMYNSKNSESYDTFSI